MNRVAIDIRYLTENPTGVGRYIYKLIKHLMELNQNAVQFYLLGHTTNFQFLEPIEGAYEKLLSPCLPTEHPKSDIWFYRQLPKMLAESDIELFHATALGAPSRPPPIPWLVTLHDLAGFIVPDTLSFLFRQYLNWQTKLAMKNTTTLITTTQSVAQEIPRFFPEHPPVCVIPLGFEKKNFTRNTSQPGLNIKNRFILFVGTLEKRKGLLNLLHAFHLLRQNIMTEPLDLVLCGKMDFAHAAIRKAMEQSPNKDSIHLTGYVSETDLNSYFKHSSLTVIPSLYEGFGLPVLEAMQGNAPILVNDIPVFHETGGDLLQYTSFSNAEMAARDMAKCLKNPLFSKDRYPEYQQHLNKHKWVTCAESTFNLYLKTMEITSPSQKSGALL